MISSLRWTRECGTVAERCSIRIMKILWVAAVLIELAESADSNLSCKDAEGNNVEWSVIYKLPNSLSSNSSTPSNSSKPSNSSSKNGGHGEEYGYIDSRMIADGKKNFTMGEKGIFTDEKNPLANSLEPIFKWKKTKADKELVYIAYNDQPPDDEATSGSSSGHTKGLVLFDSEKGLWLVHSVPKFPEELFSGNYSFPKNGHTNGQTLLCMTFEIKVLNTIAAHLLNQKPHIFESHATESIKAVNPQLELLLSGKPSHNETDVLKTNLSGIHGTPFLAFAKSGKLDDDVYSKSLAPALGSDLYVSSWQNGEGGKLDSECDLKQKVLDVESVSFTFNNSGVAWSTKNDHSKWAVTQEDAKWLCIGSINRMRSQFKRGGETVCLQEKELGKLFRDAVTNHTTCGD